MAKDAVGGISRASRPTTMVPTKPPPPPSGAVKLVKKATERLEEDAKEMEDRLMQLRLSMLEEKKKRDRELPAKHGGNRWRSAREDRGSVSKYAHDVQNNKLKVNNSGGSKKAGGDPDTKSTTKKKKKKTEQPSSSDPNGLLDTILSVATVPKWTTNQVLEWLSAIGLEEFQSGFEYHQITGGTLLELTLDEFTQIGVMKLSARNILYTEIEKIRDKNTLQASEQHQPIEIIDPKLRGVNPEVHSPQSKAGGGGGGVHWSQLKPLSETTVALGGNGEVPVNLADGEFDEDESHASFMKALLEWRSTDNDEQAHEGGKNGGKEDEELWVNPMLIFASEEEEEKIPGGGGALLDGSYDEEKEQEAFRRAVEAWRTGASASSTAVSSTNNSIATSVEQIEQDCTAAQRKSCWQCYQIVNVDSLIVDERTRKPFCSATCQSVYHQEYSRFYQKQ